MQLYLCSAFPLYCWTIIRWYFFLTSSSALSSTQHPLIEKFVRFRIVGMDSIVIHGDELSDIRSIGI
jgi:hypothetical protein